MLVTLPYDTACTTAQTAPVGKRTIRIHCDNRMAIGHSPLSSPQGFGKAIVIPALTHSGVLPPFAGASSADPGMSPYPATMLETAVMFCKSAQRAKLFRGLIDYRTKLLAMGLSGAQWLDGSFCEDVESNQTRPPNDIDIVTLLVRPPALATNAAWAAALTTNTSLFERDKVKANFHCDPFFVDIGLPAALVVDQLTYYFGLFTHQRVSYLWKGLVQVPLPGDDNDAVQYLDSVTYPP
jgi:uncharacterized protein DUF6932